jgi:hypothetical protein
MITAATDSPAREALLNEDFAPQLLPARDPEMAAHFDAWWNGMLPEERDLLRAMNSIHE